MPCTCASASPSGGAPAPRVVGNPSAPSSTAPPAPACAPSSAAAKSSGANGAASLLTPRNASATAHTPLGDAPDPADWNDIGVVYCPLPDAPGANVGGSALTPGRVPAS